MGAKLSLWKSQITAQAIGTIVLSLLTIIGCGGSGSSGGSGNISSTGTASSLSAGDASFVSFSNSAASINFSGIPSGATYELLIQSPATNASSTSFTLSNLSEEGSIAKSVGFLPVSEEENSKEPTSLQISFEQVLRDEEKYLQSEPLSKGMEASLSKSLAAKSVSKGSSVSATISVNDTDTFRVLDSLTNVTQYVTVTATAKCVNDKVAVFVDNEISTKNPSDLSQGNIDSLCSTYATQLASVRSWFGDYPDINNDGVVVALITSQINKLGSSGGGIVTGFFYSGDLFDRSSSIPASNKREIVYLVSPDSGGIYGTKITTSFAMTNFLQAVFPHEMQHLISYYQHTIVRGGSAEADWLNEALSHLTEDLVGYGVENYSRYNIFLSSPSSYSLVTSSSPGLGARGASYLFMRYLYEQSGKSATFLKNMVQTTNTGVANVEAAYPASSSDFNEFAEFLRYWAAALAYTDRGLTSSSALKYQARGTDSVTGNPTGVCMVCNANDNRSTVLSGPSFGTFSTSGSYTVKPSATRFLRLSSVPSTLNLSIGAGEEAQVILLRTQ